MNIASMLEELGFSNTEAQLFITLRKHGACTVSELARKSGIARRSVYDNLNPLMHKGIVSSVKENDTQVYRACAPKALSELYSQRIALVTKELQTLTVPTSGKEPTVELFTGRQGIKLILADIIENSDEHWAFGHLEHLHETMKHPIQQFLRRKEQSNHTERFLGEKGVPFNTIQKGEYKVLPKKHMPPAPVIIYANSVALFIETENPYTIKITHPTVAQSYREYFKKYWDIAEAHS